MSRLSKRSGMISNKDGVSQGSITGWDRPLRSDVSVGSYCPAWLVDIILWDIVALLILCFIWVYLIQCYCKRRSIRWLCMFLLGVFRALARLLLIRMHDMYFDRD